MSVKTLQGIVGAFFIILGVMGMLPTVNEGIFSINNNKYALEALFGVVELLCGLVMVFGLFSPVRRKTMHQACMLVFAFWIARMVFSVFIWGSPVVITLATGLNWLLLICVEAIIASSVWLLAQTYRR